MDSSTDRRVTWRDQAEAAYRRMAREARYRPAAPSDGNITQPLRDLDLAAEARLYATKWREQEDAQDYPIGCPYCIYTPGERQAALKARQSLLRRLRRQGRLREGE